VNLDAIRAVANAVLYEGYMLYPYRPSALKNRSQGWSFGTLLPPEYVQENPGESDCMQAQVVLVANMDAVVTVEARFLQLGESAKGVLERNVIARRSLRECVATQLDIEFKFGPHEGDLCESIEGRIEIGAEAAGESYRLTVCVTNRSQLPQTGLNRDQALTRALIAAHALVTIEGGEFISLLDPSDQFRGVTSDCKQRGVFPVMVGEEGERTAMLLSPIILYDYPKIAAQSKGDFFDSFEIDEMLSLRVLTLSDAEKEEIRARGGPASQILERTETLSRAELSGLHGSMYELSSSEAKR
jgi:hypothetical protein